MYELIQAGPCTWYINCPAKIGLYRRPGGEVFLIDSGGDQDAGKKVLRILAQQNWTLCGVINTHSHADHIGGNRYLQQKTGCMVFAGGIEAAFTHHPVLEPSFLYGGYAPRELRHKFLLAAASDVTPFEHKAFPAELSLIPLPGHSFDMVGVRTPDDVVFLADCVSSPRTLEKYRLPFQYNVAASLDTLSRVEAMNAALFIPSHADASQNIHALVQLNRQALLDAGELILSLLDAPTAFEALLSRVFCAYSLEMTFEQHALVGSTVRSFLSWLAADGRVAAAIENNQMVWKRV